jgi:hypothetical protein
MLKVVLLLHRVDEECKFVTYEKLKYMNEE